MMSAMLQLGPFQFSVDTAAYQQLRRETQYRWQGQQRVGAHDALQFTGYGSDSIEVNGIIYPDYKGGSGQLARMRAVATLGTPMPLVSSGGIVFGLYVIQAITEGQSIFARRGAPRRQTFSMTMRRYDGGLSSLLPF